MADARVDILLSLRSDLKGSNEAIASLSKLAGGLTLAGAAYKAFSVAQDSARLAGEIKNLAAEANLTTDAFQTLKLGSAEYGVTQENIVRGAVTLRKNLEDAAKDGAAPLNDHLRRLGLTAAGLQALAPERQFEAIGRAIANATDKEAAFAAGLALLGTKDAPKLMEFLRDLGSDGFGKIAKATKNLTLTKDELDTLDKAGNAWERIGNAMKIAGARATLAAINLAQSPGVRPGQAVISLGGGVATLAAERAIAEARERTASATAAAAAEAQRVAKAEQDAVAAEQRRVMAAAELADTLKGIADQDRDLRRDIENFNTKTLNDGRQAVLKREAEELAAHERDAERYKNMADPVRAFRLELDKLVTLKREGLLTDVQAAAAAKVLTQQFLEQAGQLGSHTRRLSELAEKRQLIEGDPFLTAEAKRSAVAQMLGEENIELDRQIALLRQKQILTPGESRQLDDLVKRRTDNQFNPAGFSFGTEVKTDLLAWSNSFGTQAQQVSGLLTNTIGRAVDGISRGIAGWITGTVSWRQMLAQIGTGILEEIISTLVRIGVQQVINATIGRSLQAAALSATLATTAGTAAAISAMMIAPATLATIATLGEAALAAPEEILAALAATAPLGLFSEGGHTGDGGIVHAEEWVAPAWMVSDPVYGGVIDSLEAARTGSAVVAPTAAATACGGDARPQRDILVVGDLVTAKQLARDPQYDSTVVRAVKRNRGDFLT